MTYSLANAEKGRIVICMKTRRHHNNKGTRQVKRGRTVAQVKRIARKLRVPFITKQN